MSDSFWDEPQDAGRNSWRNLTRTAIWILLGLLALTGLTLIAAFAVRDDQRDSAAYREAQSDGRALGPTTGRLDDGTLVGAAAFIEADGRICALYGPPGERSEERYCIVDSEEEVDAVNWTIPDEGGIDMTIAVLDGADSSVEYGFEGPTPGFAQGRFEHSQRTISVYVGPTWDSFDADIVESR